MFRELTLPVSDGLNLTSCLLKQGAETQYVRITRDVVGDGYSEFKELEVQMFDARRTGSLDPTVI